MFSAFFRYSEDVMNMLENSAFFEDLIYWVEKNSKYKLLPEFDDGRLSLAIELVQTPFLFYVDNDNQTAQYSATFRLVYKERKL